MKKILVFLAEGFEEIEALTPVDVLRRAGCEVTMVSIAGKQITSSRKITVVADKLFEEVNCAEADMLILPGGAPGSQNLDKHIGLKKALTEANQNGKLLAAICAAPMVLGHLNILQGKKATCYPGNEPDLIGAQATGSDLEIDGKIITSNGAGSSLKFSLALVEKLFNKEKAKEIAEKMMAGNLYK